MRALRAVTLTLPWPPSLNSSRSSVKGRLILTVGARAYYRAVQNALPTGPVDPLSGRLHVTIRFWPPSRIAGRKWDIANREKIVCDALTKQRVWIDDEQIDTLMLLRGSPTKHGQVTLVAQEVPALHEFDSFLNPQE